MRSEDPAGTRRQRGLRGATPYGLAPIPYPVRGRIDGVQFRGSGKNKSEQTLVDVTLYGWYAPLYGVPIVHAKINAANGEDWTPEVGDLVVVQFFGGDPLDPVVTGYLPRPGNEIEAAASEAPRFHKARNGTTETVTKTGSRTVHVAEHETLDVVGNGTVTLGGNLTVTVGGNATVNVTGNADVTSGGKITITAAANVEIDGGSSGVKGVVQADCLCMVTGKPHMHVSKDVKASEG